MLPRFWRLQKKLNRAVQIDWGEATIIMDGEKEKINLFCARLCHSCAPYVIAYKRQNLESFLDAIIHTFQYFGGVPRRLIFDNARVAVKSGFGAQLRRRMITANWPPTTALSRSSAIPPPATKKDWLRTW